MTDDHKTKIVPAETVSVTKQDTEMHPLVKLASQNGTVDTSIMRELMELQRDWERDNAKKEYLTALTRVKATMPSVIKRNAKVAYGKTGYSFATLAHMMRLVQPHLVNHGFQLSWEPSTEQKLVTVTCRLTHVGGHSESATISAAADNSGAKNAVQAIGSTITYLERYTAASLLGISTDDMDDADFKQDDNRIDSSRNLKALGVLSSEGITKNEAEEYLQSSLKNWTVGDLEKLKDLVRDRRSVPVDDKQPNDGMG